MALPTIAALKPGLYWVEFVSIKKAAVLALAIEIVPCALLRSVPAAKAIVVRSIFFMCVYVLLLMLVFAD